MKWFKPTPPTADKVLVDNMRAAIKAFNDASQALDAANIKSMYDVETSYRSHNSYMHSGYKIKLLFANRVNTENIYGER